MHVVALNDCTMGTAGCPVRMKISGEIPISHVELRLSGMAGGVGEP